MLTRYKAWVKQHPGIVQNLDWLLYLTVWNPGRLQSSEFTYEAYHAAIGLLSLWHQNMIEEDELPVKRPFACLWLDALEQVETLIELRGMYLEQHQRLSRYSPLAVVETVKALLKMVIMSQYPGHVFLRHPSPDDLHQFESEQGVKDLHSAMCRLKERYSTPPEHHDPLARLSLHCPVLDIDAEQCSTSQSAPCTSASKPSTSRREVYGLREVLIDNVADLASWFNLRRPGSHLTAGHQTPSQSSTSCSTAPESHTRTHAHRADACSTCQTGARWSADGTAYSYEDLSPPGKITDKQVLVANNMLWLSEVMHIWRPVAYVLLLKRYGRTSWIPWSGSLAIDILSLKIHEHARWHAHQAHRLSRMPRTSLLSVALVRALGQQQWSVGEDKEMYERRRRLFLYLLRSPVLDIFIKSSLGRVRDATSCIPLVGFATDYLHGMVDTFTQYYTYTSGSG